MKKICVLTALAVCLLLSYCQKGKEPMEKSQSEVLSIQANLVFFYYPSLEEAEKFYGNLMGFEKVLDYGFAKIFRISSSTFIGLVDETKGMHDPEEPKSVTLSFATAEIDQWYRYLTDQKVPMHRPLSESERIPIKGFVALDPAGYFLEFETFLAHPQNELLHEHLAPAQALYPHPQQETTRPADCGILANVIWLYYRDIPKAQAFYENNFGFKLLVDQGFAKVYSSSPTGFIGLVDESQGLHRYTAEKAVNVCFLTDQIDDWYRHFQTKKVNIKDALEEAGSIPVKAFVAFDSGGYFIEFDHFLEDIKNQRIRKLLR
ncbi:MAG: VOC family protein [Candidatus Aminicenantes bacterium]|nr:MAG: VOC family protein [Candidatus Aminicenantes bacterium]